MVSISIESSLFIFFGLLYAVSIYISWYLHAKKYALHLSYEDTSKLRIFLLKYPLVFFVLWSVFILFENWLLLQIDGWWQFQQFTFGALTAIFATLSGSAIGGIVIFRHVLRNPEEISGQLFLKSPKLVALHQLYAIIPTVFTLIPLYAMYREAFILGALCGTSFYGMLLSMRALKNK